MLLSPFDLVQQTENRNAVRRANVHLAIGDHRRHEMIERKVVAVVRGLIAVIQLVGYVGDVVGV